jgi:hypothetical protein
MVYWFNCSIGYFFIFFHNLQYFQYLAQFEIDLQVSIVEFRTFTRLTSEVLLLYWSQYQFSIFGTNLFFIAFFVFLIFLPVLGSYIGYIYTGIPYAVRILFLLFQFYKFGNFKNSKFTKIGQNIPH